VVHISGVNNLPGAPPRSSGVQRIREPPQRRKEKHPRDRSGCGPKRVRAAPLLRKAHAAIIGRFVGRSLSSVRPCTSLGRRRDAGKNARSLPPQQPLPGSSSRARRNELASPYAKQISICSGRTLGQFVNWGSLAIQLSFRLFISLKMDSMVIPILSGRIRIHRHVGQFRRACHAVGFSYFRSLATCPWRTEWHWADRRENRQCYPGENEWPAASCRMSSSFGIIRIEPRCRRVFVTFESFVLSDDLLCARLMQLALPSWPATKYPKTLNSTTLRVRFQILWVSNPNLWIPSE